MFSYGFLHMDTPGLANQLKTYIHQLYADTGSHLEDLQRVMTNRIDDEKESRESMRSAHHENE